MNLKKKIITLINVIKLNIIIFKFKIFNPNKKVIFFYHPRKLLTLIHINYIMDLFNSFNKNYLILYGHEVDKFYEKNHYFVSHSFLLKWIFKVDIFISVNVCDVFTNNSKKIYIHHDISTTPLVNEEKEKILLKRLLKYDFIFAPNKPSVSMFVNFFKKYNSNLNLKIPKIAETGYLRLDYLKKNNNLDGLINNSIVIAPTDYRHIENLSMFNDIEKIIKDLLLETSFNIVFRPYPALKSTLKTLKIKNTYESNKRFKFDTSENYSEIYLKSTCMITDTSGTAYTYAFFTKKPVIFISKNEKFLKELGYNKLDYFVDREKIGIIIEDINEIKNSIKNILSIEKKTKPLNDLLENEITYLGKSKSRIFELIENIEK
tara:strand:+ start:4000 stop:5124 length:1125 start_codon:yes stop_codon:yes gene_type:complete